MWGKTRLVRVVIVTAVIAVAALAVAALLGLATGGLQPNQVGRAGGTTVDERKSLPADGVDEISIRAVSEDVRVVEGEGTSIEAWFHGTTGNGRPESLRHLLAERTGSTASFTIERPSLTIGYFWSDLHLDVTVPKGYAGKLDVGSVSADVDVSAHPYAGVAVSTTSGDVTVGAVQTESFALHTTSGRLRATGLRAKSADLSAVSGDLQLESFAGDAKVSTTSGDVSVAYVETPRSFDAHSASGTVKVKLPESAQFTLDARSTSGDITCKFPITIGGNKGQGSHVLSGAVGNGDAKLSLRTTSGDIRVER